MHHLKPLVLSEVLLRDDVKKSIEKMELLKTEGTLKYNLSASEVASVSWIMKYHILSTRRRHRGLPLMCYHDKHFSPKRLLRSGCKREVWSIIRAQTNNTPGVRLVKSYSTIDPPWLNCPLELSDELTKPQLEWLYIKGYIYRTRSPTRYELDSIINSGFVLAAMNDNDPVATTLAMMKGKPLDIMLAMVPEQAEIREVHKDYVLADLCLKIRSDILNMIADVKNRGSLLY